MEKKEISQTEKTVCGPQHFKWKKCFLYFHLPDTKLDAHLMYVRGTGYRWKKENPSNVICGYNSTVMY